MTIKSDKICEDMEVFKVTLKLAVENDDIKFRIDTPTVIIMPEECETFIMRKLVTFFNYFIILELKFMATVEIDSYVYIQDLIFKSNLVKRVYYNTPT